MLRPLVSTLHSLIDRREAGQGMVEYGLIIALVAVVIVAAIALLGPAITTAIQGVAASFPAP